MVYKLFGRRELLILEKNGTGYMNLDGKWQRSKFLTNNIECEHDNQKYYNEFIELYNVI